MIRSILIGAVFGLVVTYLGAAFVAWELNPGEWNEGGRVMVMIISFSFAGLLAIHRSDSC
jgi:hypothetical protein